MLVYGSYLFVILWYSGVAVGCSWGFVDAGFISLFPPSPVENIYLRNNYCLEVPEETERGLCRMGKAGPWITMKDFISFLSHSTAFTGTKTNGMSIAKLYSWVINVLGLFEVSFASSK